MDEASITSNPISGGVEPTQDFGLFKENEENPEKTGESRNPDGTFKKGISGNPNGRPKGSGMTLKEYASRKLKDMTDEEKENFLKGLSSEIIWKMSEGMPKQDTDITSGGEKIIPIYGGFSRHPSDKEDIQPKEEN